METTKLHFSKLAHLFAHRKAGAQSRFRRVYDEVAAQVREAWTADLLKMEQVYQRTSKSNVALAKTSMARQKNMAEQLAKDTINTVFSEYRAEIDRITTELGGHPQEDGNVLFPDGSIARMPKGLFIEEAKRLRFE